MYAFIDYYLKHLCYKPSSMLANDPSSSKLERVHEQSAQENLSVQHICCPPTTIREHEPKQAIDYGHMHSVSSGTT